MLQIAAAVILSLGENNPVNSSRAAKVTQDKDSVESAILVYIGSIQAKTLASNTTEEVIRGNTTYTSSYGIIGSDTFYQARATSVNGYQISIDGGVNWDNKYDDNVFSTSDLLYVINSSSDAMSYWIASPSDFNTVTVNKSGNSGDLGYNNCGNGKYGFRPVVCIKSGVTLIANTNGSVTLN